MLSLTAIGSTVWQTMVAAIAVDLSQYSHVSIDENGKIIPLDMPVKYICEMLCDWSSFQFVVDKNSTASDWYQKNKNKMVLSDSTRQTVEELLKIAPKL